MWILKTLKEFDMNWILSFCGKCAALLPRGLGDEKNPICPNCGGDVSKREYRCEGEFSEKDAKKLLDNLGG